MSAIATRSTYRDSQTPAQQLYSELCTKGKVRPDPQVNEGLASRGLVCNIDKWTPPDCSVLGMLSRRLKGYTHISIALGNNGSTRATGSKKKSTRSSRKSSRTVAHVGPDEDAITVICSSVGKSLQMCPKLVSIELPGLNMSHSALRHLGRGLIATTSLKRLDLRTCGIGDEGLSVLVKALIGCKSLNDLCLAGNRLKDISAPRVSSIIRRHGARRDDGFWASCLRDGAMSAASTRGLEPTNAEVNVQLHGLTALDVSDNFITNEGARYIASTLESDGWLVALNLRGNQISAEGADALKAALQINESLSVIDFRPREEAPTFDEMGHIIRSSPKKSRQAMMGWAMRRKPRKGIGAEHPKVQSVLTRWGLAGERSHNSKSRNGLLSARKSSGGSERKKSVASRKFDASQQQTRMSSSASSKSKKKSGGSTSNSNSNSNFGSDIDTKRSSHSSTISSVQRSKSKQKGKSSNSSSNKKGSTTPLSKKRTVSSKKNATTTASSSSSLSRPKSARTKTGGESLNQRFSSMERPKTASGGNRSRRSNNNKNNVSSINTTSHPGIVGLGPVEPQNVQLISSTASLSEGMSPEQLQSLVASRLKELIQERSEIGGL